MCILYYCSIATSGLHLVDTELRERHHVYMKNIILVAVAVIALTGFIAYRIATNNPAETSPALADNTLIIDVRNPEEFAVSHVQSATLLPVGDIAAGKMPNVPKDTPMAVYCRSGNRSSQATQLLKQASYTNVRDLGGLDDLKKYGLEVK